MIDIKKVGDRVVSWPDGRVTGTVVQIIERFEVHQGLLFVGGDLLIVRGDDGEEHRAPVWLWWKEEFVPKDVLSKKKT